MAEYTCPICNKTFIRRGKRKPRCCSLKCYADSMRGTKLPKYICAKISKNHSRHSLGKKMSDEQKAKVSESRKGKHMGTDHWAWKGGIAKGVERTCLLCGNKYIAHSWSQKYCSKECYWKSYPNRIISFHGYILIKKWSHPFASKQGYVAEHRLIAESILGRYLTKKEIIHHIDENRSNNDPDNLYLFPNKGQHANYHRFHINNPNIKITKSNLIAPPNVPSSLVLLRIQA